MENEVLTKEIIDVKNITEEIGKNILNLINKEYVLKEIKLTESNNVKKSLLYFENKNKIKPYCDFVCITSDGKIYTYSHNCDNYILINTVPVVMYLHKINLI